MSSTKDHTTEDDRAFEELFSSLNNITASDELKASTLSALFAAMDEEEPQDDPVASDEPMESEPTLEVELAPEAEPTPEAEPVEEAPLVEEKTVEKTAQRPTLKLVEDEPAATQAPTTPARVPKQRTKSWKLRVAAAILVVVIGLSGGIAYAVPAKHVQVTVGDATFNLGVNVFGMTVSAEANSDEAAATLASAGIQHMRFEDSLDKLLGSFDGDFSAPSVTITVEGQPAREGQTLSEEAARIVERHEQKLEENALELQREEAARTQEQGTAHQQEHVQPQEQPSSPTAQEQPSQQQGGGQGQEQGSGQGQGVPSEQAQPPASQQEQQPSQPQAAQAESTAQPVPQSQEPQAVQGEEHVFAEGARAPEPNGPQSPGEQR